MLESRKNRTRPGRTRGEMARAVRRARVKKKVRARVTASLSRRFPTVVGIQ